MRRTVLSAALALCAALSLAGPVQAAGPSLIRDAEIEDALRAEATPIWKAAGLSPDAVKLYVVADKELNAFVAGGMNIFVHTGLIMRSETPDELLGVIAHETGHIAGGHLTRARQAMERASAEALAAMAVGAAAAVASGKAEIGQALMMGGQSLAQRHFFAYTRAEESSADQAAVRYLHEAGRSAEGLVSFMETLEDQEILTSGNQDPYMRSHPVTRERIVALRHHTEREHAVPEPDADLLASHARLRAKLVAFTEPAATVLRRYPESDTGATARYARAVAAARSGRIDAALPEIDALLAAAPEDAYLHELKGQLLFENGRIRDALGSYARAVDLRGHPLMRIAYAHAMIEAGDAGLIAPARDQLRAALEEEPTNASAWRLMAAAAGRAGDAVEADAAMAESALLSRRAAEALYYASRAETGAKPSSPVWFRLQDIKAEAERLKSTEG